MYDKNRMLSMVAASPKLLNEMADNGYSKEPKYYIDLLSLPKINFRLKLKLQELFRANQADPEFMEKYNLLVIPELRPEPTANRVCILVAGGIVQEVYASEPLDCFVTDLDIEGTDNPEEWNTIIEGTHKIL